MPTLSRRSRTRDILKGTQAFPPEGLREPFKPIELQWTQRFPFGISGQNTTAPADVLQPGEAVKILDYKTNLGDLELAWGYTGVSTPKGTPIEILNLSNYKTIDGAAFLVRIDKDEVQFWNASTWATATGSMTGAVTDPIYSAMVLNKLIFCNGVDEAQAWTGGATYADLTVDVNAPAAPRQVIGFADRAVFADIGAGASRNTQRIVWSASGDETDFTATGSGGVSLLDTQGTQPADDIMGLAVQNNFLLIIRRYSIWTGTRTGEATLPISFNSRVQGFGCIASKTVVDCGAAGVAYLGHNNIYLYNPGLAEPIPIGTPIRPRIFDGGILDRSKLDKAHFSYVPSTQELWCFIPDTTNANPRTAFVFNLERYTENEEYVWRERLFLTDMSASIGGQTTGLGTSGVFTDQEKKLVIADRLGDTFDSDSSDTTNDGTVFTAEFESAQFVTGNTFVEFKRVNIAYKATASSVITLDFSVDGGDNWTDNVNYTLPAVTEVSEASMWVPQGIYDRGVQFRVRAAGDQTVRFVGYRVAFLEKGPIRGL